MFKKYKVLSPDDLEVRPLYEEDVWHLQCCMKGVTDSLAEMRFSSGIEEKEIDIFGFIFSSSPHEDFFTDICCAMFDYLQKCYLRIYVYDPSLFNVSPGVLKEFGFKSFIDCRKQESWVWEKLVKIELPFDVDSKLDVLLSLEDDTWIIDWSDQENKNSFGQIKYVFPTLDRNSIKIIHLETNAHIYKYQLVHKCLLDYLQGEFAKITVRKDIYKVDPSSLDRVYNPFIQAGFQLDKDLKLFWTSDMLNPLVQPPGNHQFFYSSIDGLIKTVRVPEKDGVSIFLLSFDPNVFHLNWYTKELSGLVSYRIVDRGAGVIDIVHFDVSYRGEREYKFICKVIIDFLKSESCFISAHNDIFRNIYNPLRDFDFILSCRHFWCWKNEPEVYEFENYNAKIASLVGLPVDDVELSENSMAGIHSINLNNRKHKLSFGHIQFCVNKGSIDYVLITSLSVDLTNLEKHYPGIDLEKRYKSLVTFLVRRVIKQMIGHGFTHLVIHLPINSSAVKGTGDVDIFLGLGFQYNTLGTYLEWVDESPKEIEEFPEPEEPEEIEDSKLLTIIYEMIRTFKEIKG